MNRRYFTGNGGKTITLREKIGSGGEGSVFAIAENQGIIAKLYHPSHCDERRKHKIEALLAKGISISEAQKRHIALPLDTLYDTSGSFVGYIMPRVEGYPLRLALFSKNRVRKYYPHLDRIQLAELAYQFVKQVHFLHRHNILIGDINPLNLLIDRDDPTICWLIDTDSFQVDTLPCPVGTDLFTPPHLQGRDFKETLRSKEDEYFSTMIMLFMILMLGKHPYAKVGGSSPAENIKKRSFAYPRISGSMADVPRGIWGFIWTNFNAELKNMFYDCFAQGVCTDTETMKRRINTYRHYLEKGYFSKELYPLSHHIKDGIEVSCEICKQTFSISKSWHDKLHTMGKAPRCAICQQKIQASILAKKIRKEKIANRKRLHESDNFHSLFNSIF